MFSGVEEALKLILVAVSEAWLSKMIVYLQRQLEMMMLYAVGYTRR
jgi:hypothetical protein